MLSFPVPKWQATLKPVVPLTSGKPTNDFGRTASPILPRLYLSDYSTARSAETIERLGVTHVVSCIEGTPEIPESVKSERKLHVPISDRTDVDVLKHLEHTTLFIRTALEEEESNVVLVHCLQGISRSATVVCAYLIVAQNMTYPQAMRFLQSKREIVCPNFGFRKQLDVYATKFISVRKQGQEGRENRGMKSVSEGIAGRIRKLRRESWEVRGAGGGRVVGMR